MHTRSTRSARAEIPDIAIAGAGPVGLAAALSLANAGFRVSIAAAALQQSAPNTSDTSARVYALAPDVLSWLATALQIPLEHAIAYRQMKIWEGSESGALLKFSASDYGWDYLGKIVSHSALQHALQLSVEQHPGIRLHLQDASGYQMLDAGSAIQMQFGDTAEPIRASLLLDASGTQSTLRAKAGVLSHDHDYQQHAVVAMFQANTSRLSGTADTPERPEIGETAWQCFAQQSVAALLPVGEQRYVLVFSTPSARASVMQASSAAQLLEEVNRFFGNLNCIDARSAAPRLSELLSPVSCIPLRRMLAQDYVRERLVLIGDSAHCVHPLAGQGLNLGMRDVICLTKNLSAGSPLPTLANPQRALQQYARERKSENTFAALGIEALQRGFAPSKGPLQVLRSLGLRAVQRIDPLKRLFAELAAGKVAGWP